MTTRSALTEEQARAAMQTGELPQGVRNAAPWVAIVLTQGWCPQWRAMEAWLSGMVEDGAPQDQELAVFELVYDLVPYFDEFREFKESRWHNYEIPYVRYYTDGNFVGESNYTSARRFLSRFA